MVEAHRRPKLYPVPSINSTMQQKWYHEKKPKKATQRKEIMTMGKSPKRHPWLSLCSRSRGELLGLFFPPCCLFSTNEHAYLL